MTAFLWAALAVEASNVSPAGDIYLTASAGEIGGTTTDESWDPRTVGSGIGTRRLVDGGITGDYAIVAETTDYAIARMECGVVWFEITITGSPTYQPRLAAYEPDTVMDEHPGPGGVQGCARPRAVGSEYSNSETKEYDHGTMRPQQVSARSSPGTRTRRLSHQGRQLCISMSGSSRSRSGTRQR